MIKFINLSEDYKIDIGHINWQGYVYSWNLDLGLNNWFVVKRLGDFYHIFTQNKEDGNYLKIRFPEWFL